MSRARRFISWAGYWGLVPAPLACWLLRLLGGKS